MAKINLLAWREEHRREKKKEFYTHLAMVCVLALGIGVVWMMTVDRQISHQKNRNDRIQKEITQLEVKVKEIQELKKRRAELISRINVIQGLQGTRPTIVRYFDEIVRAVPDGLYFNSIRRQGDNLIIMGVTQSSNRVSTFMRNLDDSEWFDSPALKSIVADKNYGEQASTFHLEVKAVLPETTEGGA